MATCMIEAREAHRDVSTRGAAAHRASRAPFRLTPYLSGSFLYLAGSCCFFAGGVGATGDADGSSAEVWAQLYNVGNALFVVGSVLFVYDGHRAASRVADLAPARA